METNTAKSKTERKIKMAGKVTEDMKRYWRDKKRAWRKANPNKDAEYAKKNSGHNSKTEQKKK